MLKWNPDRMPVSACLNMYTYLQFVALIWTVKRFLTLCFEKCYTKYITISRKYYFHRLNTSVSVFCLKAVIKPALTAIFLLWTTVVSMCAPLSVSSILQSIEMLQTTLKLRWYNFLLMKLRILLKKLFGDFWRIRVGLYFIQGRFLSISSLRPFSCIVYLEKSVQWAILHVFCDDHHRLAWEEEKTKSTIKYFTLISKYFEIIVLT